MTWCILACLFCGGASRRHFAVYLLTSTPLCNFPSEFHRAYSVVHFSFLILRRGKSSPLCCLSANLYAALQFLLISHPNFTMRMTWCILSSIFYGGAFQRHFAIYLLISMPLCNFPSKYYRAYDIVRFIFLILRRGNSAPLCRLSSNPYATLQFIFQILPCI